MKENENIFPMDVIDPSRPWNFRPEGYLVVMLAGTEEAQRAETALVSEGFGPRDIKLYTGKEILDNYEEYKRHSGVTSKLVGPWFDDEEGRELYLGYAVRRSMRAVVAPSSRSRCTQSASCASRS